MIKSAEFGFVFIPKSMFVGSERSPGMRLSCIPESGHRRRAEMGANRAPGGGSQLGATPKIGGMRLMAAKSGTWSQKDTGPQAPARSQR
jgi:hypothetical protein